MSRTRISSAAVIGATGVVYGDIGTSPLYAFAAAHKAAAALPAGVAVLGTLSLIFSSLLVVVSLKYLAIVLRADNDGEGGILALLARLDRQLQAGKWSHRLLLMGMLGAALFYCDAIITPAISVLSAVEGLAVLRPAAAELVLPIALGILVGLFLVQHRGTARVSSLFGPVMVLWFVVLGAAGIASIAMTPKILLALNPAFAWLALTTQPALAFAIVGAVFLAVTGGEALYADMGHFGRGAVRVAWFGLVWPGLVLNYFGQGALLLRSPSLADSPFYRLVPEAALPALIVLATAATVIASQATITGAFSITKQAVQLDLLPRVRIIQTSARERGQIYVPVANWTLLVAVLVVAAAFGSSERLSAAYGAAVAGTMWITTVLAAVVARLDWRWPGVAVWTVFPLLLGIDTVFLAGNLAKVAQGAWVPLTLAAGLFVIFDVWRNGREQLQRQRQLDSMAVPMRDLPRYVAGVGRVPGAAVFLASRPDTLPGAFLRNLELNSVVHETVVFLHVEFQRVPKVPDGSRLDITDLGNGVYDVRARYGFMETPDIPQALVGCARLGLRVRAEYTYFLGRHVVVPVVQRREGRWQRRLFAWLQRRATGAAEFFGMPPKRLAILSTVVEL
ncbi:MAG: KUP/HAK/KT family potassium transporter [Chromatiales bacterium]|nr:KUP/HAK/KT family potassium transporter [Chromatiales bacterium]